jgi:virulence-associated protein VapD
MGKYDKLLIRLLSGASDSSIAFDDLRQLLIRFGFNERIRGSHHIYTKVVGRGDSQFAAQWFQGEALSSQAGSCRYRAI